MTEPTDNVDLIAQVSAAYTRAKEDLVKAVAARDSADRTLQSAQADVARVTARLQESRIRILALSKAV